ncbi:MAG: cytochrome PufQ [Pseudomonadota bacterium]
MLDVTPTLDDTAVAPRRTARRKPAEYRFYYAIVFAVALPVAVVGRLFPRRLGHADGAPAEGLSILEEARGLTNTVVPYLFMG